MPTQMQLNLQSDSWGISQKKEPRKRIYLMIDKRYVKRGLFIPHRNIATTTDARSQALYRYTMQEINRLMLAAFNSELHMNKEIGYEYDGEYIRFAYAVIPF